MPMYEYRCSNCGQRFEVLQKFSDDPLTVHAACGGGPVERLISAPALQFKGSGWYVTDYAKNNGNAAGDGKPATTEPKSEGSGESKAESSTPAKTESAPVKPATPAPASSSSDKP